MSIKIENVITPSPSQWMAVIYGMRNPMNSWDKCDSAEVAVLYASTEFRIGEADMDLMKRLARAGSDHRKFLRMLPVWMDVTAPLYWWKEFETYKIGTVSNSCSTMHRIHTKSFSREDFSCERMSPVALECLDGTIQILEDRRVKYNETKEVAYWDDIIQLLPSSYNQKRTLCLNYEVLWAICQARKNHKLPEWRELCDTIAREIPYFKKIFEIGSE